MYAFEDPIWDSVDFESIGEDFIDLLDGRRPRVTMSMMAWFWWQFATQIFAGYDNIPLQSVFINEALSALADSPLEPDQDFDTEFSYCLSVSCMLFAKEFAENKYKIANT